MSNYKVKVNNEAESREVQGLFEQLGYKNIYYFTNNKKGLGIVYSDGDIEDISQKELTIQQLKDLVVLKRNSIDDATHIRGDGKKYFHAESTDYFYQFSNDNEWMLSTWMNYQLLPQLKPIEKKEMKEYLVPQDNGKYALTKATEKRVSDWVEVPEGADIFTICETFMAFWKDGAVKFIGADKDWDFKYDLTVSDYLDVCGEKASIVWQRHTQPEELPFVDDEPKSLSDVPFYPKPKSLNDTYAEIEQARKTLVKSDGGSSAYHQRKIPKKMLKRWKKSGMIEVTDVIRLFLNNDFTRGNVFKAHSRISSLENGCGKDGASKDYDLNKVLFFAKDDIENK